MRMRSLISMPALILAMAMAVPTAGAAQALQSHDSIRAAARDFMASRTQTSAHRQVRIQVGALDPRLRLPACSVPLQTSLPPGGRTSGRVTVGVRCTGERPWHLYVPVQVAVQERVAVARHALARGQVIAADDLGWRERDTTKLPFGYITDASGAVGKVLKRAVGAGAVLTPAVLSAPLLVRRGQTVTIIAGGDALAVRMSGHALTDGARGDLVRVRNPHSKRIVQGIAVAPGQVRTGS